MSLSEFAHWLPQREWAQDFASSSYAYPIVLATHLMCIAVFGGMILMTDLRLLGWAITSQPVSVVVNRLRWWKRLGFVIMVTCGVLLAGSEFDKYYANPYFWTKLTLLTLIGIHGLFFRRSVYYNTEEIDRSPILPKNARVAGALSLALWTCVALAGRMIAYYEDPDALIGQARPTVAVGPRVAGVAAMGVPPR